MPSVTTGTGVFGVARALPFLLLSGLCGEPPGVSLSAEQEPGRRRPGSLVVRAETNLAGHNQIGIDETSLDPDGGAVAAHIRRARRVGVRSAAALGMPGGIRGLSGRESSCVGFMYPLEAGTKLRCSVSCEPPRPAATARGPNITSTCSWK